MPSPLRARSNGDSGAINTRGSPRPAHTFRAFDGCVHAHHSVAMAATPQERIPPSPTRTDAGQAAHQHYEFFGGGGALYHRSRPAYPEALVARIVNAAPGRDILDVGCGTGIEARQFQAAQCTVLGVDPDPQFAEFACGMGVAVEVATFETWASAGRTFDAVVAGTSWHFVDPVAGAVKAAQVLRPGGLLAPFHQIARTPPALAEAIDATSPSWFSRSAPAYRQAAADFLSDTGGREGSAMDHYQPLFETIASGIRKVGEFSEPELWRFDWEQTYSRDEWLAVLSTRSAIIKRRPDQRVEVLGAVGAVIDEMGGGFSMPYTTVAVTAVRTDAVSSRHAARASDSPLQC